MAVLLLLALLLVLVSLALVRHGWAFPPPLHTNTHTHARTHTHTFSFLLNDLTMLQLTRDRKRSSDSAAHDLRAPFVILVRFGGVGSLPPSLRVFLPFSCLTRAQGIGLSMAMVACV